MENTHRPAATAALLGLLLSVAWAIACTPKATTTDDGGSLLDGGGTSLPCTTLGNSALSSLFQYDGLPVGQECAGLVSNIVFEYFQRDGGGCQSLNAGVNTLINSGGFNNPSPGISIFTANPLPFSETGTVALHVQATGYDAGNTANVFHVYGDGMETCDFNVGKAGHAAGDAVSFQLVGSCVLASNPADDAWPAHLTLSQTQVAGPLALFTNEDDGGTSDGMCPQ